MKVETLSDYVQVGSDYLTKLFFYLLVR